MIYQDNSFSIGRTPLVKLNRVVDGAKATVLAKIEGRNPAYSVKCRIGASMIWDAEANAASEARQRDRRAYQRKHRNRAGLRGGCPRLSRDSDDAGHDVAGAPQSSEGAWRKLVLTEGAKGMKGAIAKAEEIRASDPEQFFMPQQFKNPANPDIHFKTTGPEIWEDTDGEVDVLVSGVGTGGTITGVSRYIKNEKKHPLISVAVEPTASPVITQTLNKQE